MLRPDAPTERQGKLTLRKEEPIIPSAIHLYLKRLRVARAVAPFLRRILRQRRYARKLGLFRTLYLLLAGKFRVHSVTIAVPGIMRGVKIRLDATDKQVFEQIFVDND
jgi:hypothetical protein